MKTDLPLLDPSGAADEAALPLPDPLPRGGFQPVDADGEHVRSEPLP